MKKESNPLPPSGTKRPPGPPSHPPPQHRRDSMPHTPWTENLISMCIDIFGQPENLRTVSRAQMEHIVEAAIQAEKEQATK